MNAPIACEETRILLGGYVLGAIEPAEAEAVRRHVADCRGCARDLSELEPLPGMLDLVADAEPEAVVPPNRLEEAVLDDYARDQRALREPRGARRRLPLRSPRAFAGGAVAVACAVALALAAISAFAPGHARSDVYSARLAGSAGATASARLVTFSAGTHVRLSVRGLRAGVYELWCLRDDGARVSAGTFAIARTGHADIDLTTAALPTKYRRMRVERQNATGRSTPVLAGTIVES